MNVNEILKHVDHTLLLQGATWEEIRQICEGGNLYSDRFPKWKYDHKNEGI